MFEHLLGEPAPPQLRAKAAMLDRLRRAGLPVPPGIVVPLAATTALRTSETLANLLQSAPVIVRSALAIEDQTTTSGAGLGESVHDCTSVEAVYFALQRIAKARTELRIPIDPSLPDQVIIQHQIAASALLVVASATELATTVEVYAPGYGALAGGAAPRFAGPLARWPGAASKATAELVRRTSALLNPEMGLDFEIVIDDAARPWLVQARPLTRDLQPGWANFSASIQTDGEALPHGWWRLDTAHNPAPLSPAHASLLSWLGRRRPGAPRTLAGWLYESVDPIPGANKETVQMLAADPFAAIDYLRAKALPQARDRLRLITDRLRGADRQLCSATIDTARETALTMLDIYAALAPARTGPRTAPRSEGAPLCLVDRRQFLDVLPCAWDIAAPSLSERLSEYSATLKSTESNLLAAHPSPASPQNGLPDSELNNSELNNSELKNTSAQQLAHVSTPSTPDSTRSYPQKPSSVSAATWLLRELDDHLFALGLAPLRRVYLQAAQLLALDEREVFLLSGEALAVALSGVIAGPELERTLAAQRQRQKFVSSLRPPPHLFNGAPLPIPAYGRFRGLGLGLRCRGPVAKRRDLADLLARPPQAQAILLMPTLTVAAAIVLDRLNIRALCTASGGALSHAALIVRELGISAIIGCRGATELCEGELIDLDPARGCLSRNKSRDSKMAMRSRNSQN